MGARVLHILSTAAAAGGTHEDRADISEAGPLEHKEQVSQGWRWGTNSSTNVGAKAAGSFNITKIAKTQKKEWHLCRVYFKVLWFPAVNPEMLLLNQNCLNFYAF